MIFIVIFHLIIFCRKELIMSENKIRNLRSKISKSLRHSENKILQKIGRKIKPKKIKPLPEYEKCFKNFEFKKADIRAKISKNAKFKNKKITKDFIIKDYEENIYNKIIKCIKKFAKTQINIKKQYEIISSRAPKIYSNLVNKKLEENYEHAKARLEGAQYAMNKTNLEDGFKLAKNALDTEYLKKRSEFLKDIPVLEPEKTYFNNSNFENLVKTLESKKEIVAKSYSSAENEINEKTIERNHKIIDLILKKEYDKIIIEFNKYVNVLEKFQKKYRIENETSFKIKF